jgi:hypothetical protein
LTQSAVGGSHCDEKEMLRDFDNNVPRASVVHGQNKIFYCCFIWLFGSIGKLGKVSKEPALGKRPSMISWYQRKLSTKKSIIFQQQLVIDSFSRQMEANVGSY